MDEKTTKYKAGAGIVIVAGSLFLPFATRENVARVVAELHRQAMPGEPPHTHSETPGYPEGTFDRGAIVSTATAIQTPSGFMSWTPRDGNWRS